MGLTVVVANPIVVGLVVANAAALLAVIVFWGRVRAGIGLEAAERVVLWLLVYPFSFFFHTVYRPGSVVIGPVRVRYASRWRTSPFRRPRIQSRTPPTEP